MKRSHMPFLLCAALLAVVVATLAYGLGAPTATLLGPALVGGEPREVALTFDDGPSEPYTAEILDILRAHRAPATFFLCGENAERHPELVRRILAEGHEIGNHTYSHPYLYLKSRAGIAAEIDRTQDVLQRVCGRRPTLFRPPFGVRGLPLWSVLRERGMRMVLWSVRGYDGRLDAEGVARTTLEQLKPGAIILLHDGFETQPADRIDRSATVRALPAIIDGVRKAGYTLVRL